MKIDIILGARMTAGELVTLLSNDEVTNEERLEILGTVTDAFCMHCGKRQKSNEWPCQCWNDE